MRLNLSIVIKFVTHKIIRVLSRTYSFDQSSLMANVCQDIFHQVEKAARIGKVESRCEDDLVFGQLHRHFEKWGRGQISVGVVHKIAKPNNGR